MFGNLIILFTVVPAIELYLLLTIGSKIGAGNTILIIIFTGVVGAYLARMQGFLVLQKIQNSMGKGNMPSKELIDGFLILIGGILLLTPGFLTDAAGFLLMIPVTRMIIKIFVQKKFEDMIRKGQVINTSTLNRQSDNYTDIDIN